MLLADQLRKLEELNERKLDIDLNSFVPALNRYLVLNELNKKEFAELLGVSGPYITQLTHDKHPVRPSLKVLIKMRDTFGMDTHQFSEKFKLDTSVYNAMVVGKSKAKEHKDVGNVVKSEQNYEWLFKQLQQNEKELIIHTMKYMIKNARS